MLPALVLLTQTCAQTAGIPPPPLHSQLPGLWVARRTLTAGRREQARAPANRQSQGAGGGLGGRMVRPEPAPGGPAPGGPTPVLGGRAAHRAVDDGTPGRVALPRWPRR